MFKSLLTDVKTLFGVCKDFAEFIIVLVGGIGICLLIAVFAYHSQQTAQAEKERASAAKEYESLSKDGVKPWREIIQRKAE